MKKYIWFNSWTEEYMEGLPIGNGRLAAMMLGRPEKLRVALNHEWLWRGEHRFREWDNVAVHLPEVRALLLQKDFLKGTEMANEYFGGKYNSSGLYQRMDPYQPAGDLWLEMNVDEVNNYTRSLDLDTGLAKTEYDASCGKVLQQTFVSCTDGCIVLDVTAENPTEMTAILSRVVDEQCTITYQSEKDGLIMQGTFKEGISFAVSAKIETDGSWRADENCLRVKDATHLLLLIQVGTNAKDECPEAEMSFPSEQCFEVLFDRHAKRFAALKGDSVLEVDVEDCELPTDQRIRLFREGAEPAMPLLYFEYGRYLMVSGSSGELPLNLQGKWNEDLHPAWFAEYAPDINLQMCYWFVEVLGMKQAADTLFHFLEDAVPRGKVAAKKMYGCNGIVWPYAEDVWRRMTPEAYGWGVWIGGASWLGQHMFMHWRYTKDRKFLKENCYPYLKEVAAFFEDYLLEKDGELWIVPSQSPENQFEGGGGPVSIGFNSAMDIELITELLQSVSECAEILNVDAEKVVKWRDMALRLPRLSVDSKGRLNEWDKERGECEPGHRHLSHIYGLYPSQLFEPGSWEWKAAECSLDVRLQHGGGHTGWSRSWVACLMARLGRREDAWEHFMALIGDFSTISLLDLHPPRIFQIDGNMGGTACVCEMLMQSRRDRLYLLPALPKAWKKGSVQNFHAQDGVLVSFFWEEGELTSFELTASEDMMLRVLSGEKEWDITLKEGQTRHVSVKQ